MDDPRDDRLQRSYNRMEQGLRDIVLKPFLDSPVDMLAANYRRTAQVTLKEARLILEGEEENETKIHRG